MTSLLVMPTDRPWRDVTQLVAAAKARLGMLTYGSSDVGSAGHLAGALLDQVARIQSVHVPYCGGGQLITDILSGKLDFACATAATTIEHVKTGRLRALAVPSATRSHLGPQLPTMAETGVSGYAVSNWYALVAPRGLPPTITDRLDAALRAVQADSGAVRKLAVQGVQPLPSSPEDATHYMAEEVAKWRSVVQAARIGLD